ncbi:MAG TPA: LCP family protein, partial [bacterium]|nr:LCP family protein [bacterium]
HLRGPALLDALQRFATQHEAWLKKAIGIWLVGVVVLSGAVTYGTLQYLQFKLGTQHSESQPSHGGAIGGLLGWNNLQEIPPEVYFGRSQLLYVLTGIDEVDFMGRTDTIMVAYIDFSRDQLKILSVPRDTVVPFGKNFQKINNAAGWVPDDPKTTQREDLDNMDQVLSDFLTVPIDNIVAVNYDGFREIIDVLGGVTVNIEKHMDYDDRRGNLHIHFDPGIQHLDGQKTLEYARYRKDAEGDFARIRRQQGLIKELKRQKLNVALVPKIPALIPAVQKAVQTQHPLTFDQTKALAAWTIGLDREKITFATIPTDIDLNGRLGSFLIPRYDETRDLLSLYFSPEPLDFVGPPIPEPEEPTDPR